VAGVDRARPAPGEFTASTRAFLRAAGVPDEMLEAGGAALSTVLVPAVWHQPVPGAKVAAARLAAAGLRLAVTSNADGRVADMLAPHAIVQVGDGPGGPVE